MLRWRCLRNFFLILLLAPVPAVANGTVTAVTPRTSPGIAYQLNTIEISGTGTCTGLQFHLGDATKTVNLPGNVPLGVYHAYSEPGTYNLKAVGLGTCSGDVKAVLQVVGPTITSVSPHSVIKPGGEVFLIGQNFGDAPGQIFIGLSGQLPLSLQNIQWAPGIGGQYYASGTIPANISGVPDEDVQIYIVTPCGNAGNSLTVHFTAARDYAAVPFGQISCSSTSGLGGSDACQNNGGYGTPAECAYIPTWGTEPGPTGFQGYHASGYGFSGESGSDSFFPFWINGWVFESASPIQGYYKGTFHQPEYQFTGPVGSMAPVVTVSWYADNCGMILFFGDVYISGPRGVPYH